MRFWLRLALGGLLLTTLPLQADEVRVAVASNFAPALAALRSDFETATGHQLRASVGSTGRHYAQIRQGAPFDLFLAADRERPERLEAEGLTIRGSRQTYVLGRLVLWAPAAQDQATLQSLFAADPPPRLAMANPRLAPYGAAAESWLREQGAWSRFQPGLVRGDNVAQAHQFVASGNAGLGLLALSQLRLGRQPVPGAWTILPASEHTTIEQQAVLLQDQAAARALLNYLLTDAVQRRLREFGYDSP